MDMVAELKAKYHSPELDDANIAVVFDDTEKVKYVNPDLGLIDYGGIKQVSPKSKPTTANDCYPDGLDFIIYINAMSWSDLTPNQQLAKMDEWLCAAGAKFVPEHVELPSKKAGAEAKKGPVVKDDKGRVVYTDEIQYDESGRPVFRTVKPDLVVYMAAVRRHGIDSFPQDQADVIREVMNAFEGKDGGEETGEEEDN